MPDHVPDWLSAHPDERAKLRNGGIIVVPAARGGKDSIHGGMVQDWLGCTFIPGATIEAVRAVMQNYAAYKDYYGPEVIESKLLDHRGSQYDIFLRLYKKEFITVVLNVNYRVDYTNLANGGLAVVSRSTRIAQVKDPERSMTVERPPGDDLGLLWALNSYWRFTPAPDGVYVQMRAISLSRELPFGLGWLKGFVKRFPRESMHNTLAGTRKAVMAWRPVRGSALHRGHGIAVFAAKNSIEYSGEFFMNPAIIGQNVRAPQVRSRAFHIRTDSARLAHQ